MDLKSWIEISMAIIMALALCLLFNNLHYRKQGIGENVIQYTSIALIIPAIVILGLEGVIQKETVATLLSGLGGYGLSSAVASRRPSPPDEPKSKNTPASPNDPSVGFTVNPAVASASDVPADLG